VFLKPSTKCPVRGVSSKTFNYNHSQALTGNKSTKPNYQYHPFCTTLWRNRVVGESTAIQLRYLNLKILIDARSSLYLTNVTCKFMKTDTNIINSLLNSLLWTHVCIYAPALLCFVRVIRHIKAMLEIDPGWPIQHFMKRIIV